MNSIKNKLSRTVNTIKAKIAAAQTRARKVAIAADVGVRCALAGEKGTFIVEHSSAMLIVLVLAALAIMLLKGLLNDTIAPTIKQKMLDFFN